MKRPIEVTIRTRKSSDLPSTAEVLIRVYELDGYPVEGVDDPEGWLNPPDLIEAWVAELCGQIVGHVALVTPENEQAARLLLRKTGHNSDINITALARLFVHPSARGRAIGEQLMRVATDHATNSGLHPILDVMAKDKAAIRIYEKLGWTRLGTLSHHFGDGKQVPAYLYAGPGL